MKLRRRRLMLVSIGVALFSVGCAPATCGNLQKDPYDVFQTYQQNCAGCHGAQLQGGIGPGLKAVGSKLTEEQILEKIKKGGTAMPPFAAKLDQKQLMQLAQMLARETN